MHYKIIGCLVVLVGLHCLLVIGPPVYPAVHNLVSGPAPEQSETRSAARAYLAEGQRALHAHDLRQAKAQLERAVG